MAFVAQFDAQKEGVMELTLRIFMENPRKIGLWNRG